MQLINEGRMPSWALFVFSEMKGNHKGQPAPTPLAAIADGFILLAPEQRNGGLEGLMLATSRVSGQKIEVDVNGTKAWVNVPAFQGSVVAREHVFVAAD